MALMGSMKKIGDGREGCRGRVAVARAAGAPPGAF